MRNRSFCLFVRCLSSLICLLRVFVCGRRVLLFFLTFYFFSLSRHLFPHHFLVDCTPTLKCKCFSRLSSAGWVTSSPATAAASTCWRRATSDISMSLEPATPRCSPLGASVTCSGTHTGATPCPPNEAQRGRGREGLEERWRVGTEIQVEEGGQRRRGGGKGCNHFSSVPKSLGGLSAGWRECSRLLFLAVGTL